MRKKILIFLGIFIFIIIPKNVYASVIYPNQAIINSTTLVDNGNPTSGRKYVAIGGVGTSATLNIIVSNFENDGGLKDWPYFVIYFQSRATEGTLSAHWSSSCNVSCFNANQLLIQYLGKSQSYPGYYRYALIMSYSKYAISGTQNYSAYIQDAITITNDSFNGNADFSIDNTVLSDSQEVSVLTQQDIINNQNSNTQSLITSFTTNTQNIINNSIQQFQQQHQDIQQLNDSLTSEEAPTNNDVSGKVSDWNSKLAGTGPVSQMVLMPITLLNGYVSGFNATCSPYNLGDFMGTDLILPCIDISDYLGASLWGVIDVLFSGFMIFAIGKKFVKIFNDFTNLRDNQMDDLYGGGK